ncbi:hypothetical protein [Rhodococcus sp. 11-3]|uniref:hypothetical protein n=1 Tax=Rhodococcus sp. 11-3 TaxID=2854796 RepID=UPI00203BA7AB|nr:hypothetical protein [Rhodococcus sp. 11-3]USC18451.1 hypothetical protein KZJ41_04810 [Rhodococcus sp. 11-3]
MPAAATTVTTEANRAFDEAERAQTIVDDAASVVPNNSVTAAKIVDGSIADVEISASAAIAQSKISGLTTDLAGKAPTSHMHTAAQIDDSTTVGRGVLTAATQSAARTAIGAGTSSLTLGTTGTTACAGNDARLADQRVPTDNSGRARRLSTGRSSTAISRRRP